MKNNKEKQVLSEKICDCSRSNQIIDPKKVVYVVRNNAENFGGFRKNGHYAYGKKRKERKFFGKFCKRGAREGKKINIFCMGRWGERLGNNYATSAIPIIISYLVSFQDHNSNTDNIFHIILFSLCKSKIIMSFTKYTIK